MKKCTISLAAALLVWSAIAVAQTPVRVRGTITAIDGNVLSVNTRDGSDLKIELAGDVAVAVATAIRFEDIRKGDYVGTTTRAAPDGTLVAVEVHYLLPTTPPGHMAWDLEPGVMMTNANVGAIVFATGRRELTLEYAGGPKTVVVPEGVPLVRGVPGARSNLKPGEYVFLVATPAPSGSLTAARVQVSKDGVRPPQ